MGTGNPTTRGKTGRHGHGSDNPTGIHDHSAKLVAHETGTHDHGIQPDGGHIHETAAKGPGQHNHPDGGHIHETATDGPGGVMHDDGGHIHE